MLTNIRMHTGHGLVKNVYTAIRNRARVQLQFSLPLCRNASAIPAQEEEREALTHVVSSSTRKKMGKTSIIESYQLFASFCLLKKIRKTRIQ